MDKGFRNLFISGKQVFIRIVGAILIGLMFPGLIFHEQCTNDAEMFLKSWLISAVIAYLVWEGNVHLTQWIYNKLSWEDNVIKRLAIQSVVILGYSLSVIIGGTIMWHSTMPIPPMQQEDWVITITVSTLMVITILAVHERIYFFRSWQDSELTAEQLKTQYAEAQYDALKMQVNPHFLFNSFNTLSSIIPEDPIKAIDFVHKMSDVYRYILLSNSKPLATIKEELAMVKAYSFLLKTRFEDDFTVEISGDVNLSGQIPPVSLQMLIENAVKHNEVTPDNPLVLTIQIQSEKIIVSNKMAPKKLSNEESTGMGLMHIKKRYEIIPKLGFEIQNKNNYFVVTLPVIHA